MDISVIAPIFNEEDNVDRLVKKIEVVLKLELSN